MALAILFSISYEKIIYSLREDLCNTGRVSRVRGDPGSAIFEAFFEAAGHPSFMDGLIGSPR